MDITDGKLNVPHFLTLPQKNWNYHRMEIDMILLNSLEGEAYCSMCCNLKEMLKSFKNEISEVQKRQTQTFIDLSHFTIYNITNRMLILSDM